MGDNTEHKLFSASSTKQWWECAGSILMKMLYPKEGSSKYAEIGTQAHAVSEKALLAILGEEYSLESALEKYLPECLDDEMIDCVTAYVETVLGIIPDFPEMVAIERKFLITPDCGGTADVAFVAKNREGERVGVIIDLKYGEGVAVEADGNLQLKNYLAGMHLTGEWGPLDRGVGYIYQPRIDHPDGELRSLKMDRAELDWFGKKIKERVRVVKKQIKDKKVEFCAGDWCRWCHGEAVCDARREKLAVSAEVDFTAPPPAVVEELPHERIALIVKHRSEIESYLKRVVEFAETEMKKGRAIPGLKLVAGRSSRRWADDEISVANSLEVLGVEDPWNKKLKGITDIEREIGKGKIDHLTIKPEPSLKIAHESDKRPAVQMLQHQGAEDDFDL
jgi:hypothetical protein